MIRAYGAHIIWIGRRQMDAAIAAKIEALARLGPTPRYLSADARDPEALQRAYDAIKQQHDSIHGVVHSAIVLRDQRLANMDEAGFRAAFSAKVDVAAAMAQGVPSRAAGLHPVLFGADRFLQAGGPEQLRRRLYLPGCLCPSLSSRVDRHRRPARH